MQHPLTARREGPPNGVVETLTAGYAAINRRLWVLLVPLLVDLFLWLGPHTSYSPLLDPAVARGTQWAQQVGPPPNDPAAGVAIDDDVGDLRQTLLNLSTETNALILLARGPLALPSIAVALGGMGALWFISSWSLGVGLLMASLVGGLVVGAFFYAAIALQVLGDAGGPLAATRRVPRAVVRVLGLVGLLLGFGLLLGVPMLAVVALAAVVAPILATVGMAVLAAGVLLAGVYLFFAVDAIFVSGVGPLAAVQRSVGVVRRHLWPTLGLVVLTWLILAGMDRVWIFLADALQPPFGIAVSMLANTYIASGLLAASMIFYYERAARD
ncbi:MAG: hypothetical protein JO023_19890 [Chloroflexi bacterium]|nr:hypothetical protein [Chloroflexota bacterium]